VTVQDYVKRLRIVLGQAGRDRIGTRPHGYVIRVDADELDLSRFEVQVAARAAAPNGSWEQAAADAVAALVLWQGEPLADVDPRRWRCGRCQRWRSCGQALEARLEADLRLGRHARCVPELQRLTRTHLAREQGTGTANRWRRCSGCLAWAGCGIPRHPKPARTAVDIRHNVTCGHFALLRLD